MAPIKALCSERYQDWNAKFSPFGLKCTELTGDTELDDFHELQYSHIVFTTPVSYKYSNIAAYIKYSKMQNMTSELQINSKVEPC